MTESPPLQDESSPSHELRKKTQRRRSLSPSSQQQQSTCSVSTMVALTFVLAIVHLGWSLSQTSQISFSFTNIQNHYYLSSGVDSSFVLFSNTTETITNTLSSSSLYKSMEDLAHLPSKWFVSQEQDSAQRHDILQQALQDDPRPFVAIVMLQALLATARSAARRSRR